jgi:hypothetical protein
MQSRVTGWWVFAAILLGVSGILNVIWGIAAIGNSHFFTANAHYIFSNLNTWGWITLIIGVLEIIAGFSLMQGGGFGKAIGITAAVPRFDRRTAVHPSRTVLVDLRVRALDHHHLRVGQDAGG